MLLCVLGTQDLFRSHENGKGIVYVHGVLGEVRRPSRCVYSYILVRGTLLCPPPVRYPYCCTSESLAGDRLEQVLALTCRKIVDSAREKKDYVAMQQC